MYQSFYGLKDKPFSMLPDPAFLYLGRKHQTALTLLEYGLYNNSGFCVISGATGAGKTTLLRQLLNSVDDNVVVGMITNTHQSFGTLLDWVMSAFNIHQPNMSKVEMHQLFVDFLLEQYSKNKTTLLIVDEAQNLPAETLEELRMLSNVNSEKDQVLQVILAGQPALKDTLRQPELMQFAQRIAVDYHLESLSLEETCGYIQHRLKTSGATKDIFTADACVRIHSYSGGTPRLINLICDTVLVYGFADQKLVIDKELIDEMVLERMKDSVVPILDVDNIDEIKNSEVDDLGFEFPSITAEEDEEPEVLEEHAAEEKVLNAEIEPPVVEPISGLEEKVHVLEEEIHELEEEVQGLEGEVHDKGLSLYRNEPQQTANSAAPRGKYLIAIFVLALLAVFLMAGQLNTLNKTDLVSDKQSKDLQDMLLEVERTKKELEDMRSREAERLLEMARVKSVEMQRIADLALEKTKEEEKRVNEEKLRAEQELKIAKEKALRAEKRIDDMFKQRKIEEQKRHTELMAREKELEKKRVKLMKVQEAEIKKRAEIQAKFDEIDKDMVVEEKVVERNVQVPDAVKNEEQPKNFVTDPCSSSSARFLSTCR